jgi:hypothetical protein
MTEPLPVLNEFASRFLGAIAHLGPRGDYKYITILQLILCEKCVHGDADQVLGRPKLSEECARPQAVTQMPSGLQSVPIYEQLHGCPPVV